MYTQFFGNFLLGKGVITAEKLVELLQKQSSGHFKLGTLAMHAGLMSASDVEHIVILQTHQDKKFGELAVEGGFLTQGQVDLLLSDQKPNYLLLGQILMDEGILTMTEFERLLNEYRTEHQMNDLDIESQHYVQIEQLISKFCDFEGAAIPEKAIAYLHLLYNNIIRFIGDDFTPLNPLMKAEYMTNYCVTQTIEGEFTMHTCMDVNRDAAIAFAARYAKEDFTEFDEYVQASLEDFLNLHNGLFLVNMSNSDSLELNLLPPEAHENERTTKQEKIYIFPIIFPFGTIHFMLSFDVQR